MNENKNIYGGLEFRCNEFERIPINRRDFGMAGVATSYTMTITSTLADYKMKKYLESEGVGKWTRMLVSAKINANFGIVNFLYKKAEGKSNGRALTETGVEIGASYLMETKVAQVAIKTGVSLLTRVATGAAAGAAAGSAFPIVGTIVGAIAGTLIAGFINDKIFEDEDEQLEKDKLENKRRAKLEEQYIHKINQINNYLITHKYIELRELNENEVQELCD